MTDFLHDHGAFERWLAKCGYWQRKVDNPRFFASMFRGRWVIIRHEDQRVIAKFHRNYTGMDVANMLVYLNGGYVGNEMEIKVVDRYSRSKKGRLEQLKAICESFKFGKMTMDVMYRQLKYYELPPKEREQRLAWIREQSAINAKDPNKVPPKKGSGGAYVPRGGVVMNSTKKRALDKFGRTHYDD